MRKTRGLGAWQRSAGTKRGRAGARNSGASAFPVRDVVGGWRDWWDDPDDHAQFQAQAEATDRRQAAQGEILSVAMRYETLENRWQRERDRQRERRS